MDRLSNAFTTIKDASLSGATRLGDFFSSSAESGVTAFKGTSLGESKFKNITAILIVVLILFGSIIYIDFAAQGNVAASPTAKNVEVERKVHIEPNIGIIDKFTSTRTLPTDVPWTVPAISMRNELKEAFGTPYTESELEKIHTKCSDSFCVMNQKSPEDLEKACNSITDRKMCGTKCCCGWTKYTGFEGDNDPSVRMNTAEAKARDPSGRSADAKIPGKCVSGDSKRPFGDASSQGRDIAYY